MFFPHEGKKQFQNWLIPAVAHRIPVISQRRGELISPKPSNNTPDRGQFINGNLNLKLSRMPGKSRSPVSQNKFRIAALSFEWYIISPFGRAFVAI